MSDRKYWDRLSSNFFEGGYVEQNWQNSKCNNQVLGQGQEQEQYSANENHTKFNTSRIYFMIACLTLVGVIITTISTLITNLDLKTVKTSITSPLQGIWIYSSKYQKYYDELDPEQLRGVGKALVIWNSFEKRYDVFIGYQINRTGARSGQQGTLAALSVSGSIETNTDGIPENIFKIGPLSLIARLHYSNEGPADGGHYQMTNCNYKSKAPRPIEIKCDFKTRNSESKIEFTRENSLN